MAFVIATTVAEELGRHLVGMSISIRTKLMRHLGRLLNASCQLNRLRRAGFARIAGRRFIG
jgi:hypothetical protein